MRHHVAGSAGTLGISRRALLYKLNEYNLRRP
jgi:hypothetical protein